MVVGCWWLSVVVGFGSWWWFFGNILDLFGSLGSLLGGLRVLLGPLGSLLRPLRSLWGGLGSSLWISWVALGRSWGFLVDLVGSWAALGLI